MNELLWNKLKDHWGHELEVAVYGNDKSNPMNVCLECLNCNEVVLDAGLYTLMARGDIGGDFDGDWILNEI